MEKREEGGEEKEERRRKDKRGRKRGRGNTGPVSYTASRGYGRPLELIISEDLKLLSLG